MKIEIYADGSDFDEMLEIFYHDSRVTGFTTNPSLMRKAGVRNYRDFVEQVTQIIDYPLSFEVFSDDMDGMDKQARILASFGKMIYVKIPITNTKGESTKNLIQSLLADGIKVNVTAITTEAQIDELKPYIQSQTKAIISIFAGRIADTGIDPKPIVHYATAYRPSNVQVLWASTREVYNIYEAESVGCHIITVPPSILSKLSLQDKDLTEYSLDTVKMFYDDAKASNYTL